MSKAVNPPTALSLDVVLFLVLSLPYFLQFQDSVLIGVTLLLAAYLLASWLPIPSSPRRLLKLTIIMLMVALTTIGPLMASIAFRLRTEGNTNAFITTGSMHDGALQTEEAVKLLLDGKNPYAADYSTSLVARYPMDFSAVNPALTHYAYPPLTFLLSVPFYWAFQNSIGWYDQRLVYGLGFLGVLVLVPFQTREPEKRLLLWIVLGMNPLLTGHLDVGVVAGVNDYWVLSLLMLAVALLLAKHRSLSAVPLALASATKPSSWFFLPFYVALLWERQAAPPFMRAVKKPAVIYGGLVTAIFLPFVLWDPGAFLEDTMFYTSGAGPIAYPIRGLGVSSILVLTGVLASPSANFPFWALELLFGGAVFMALIRRQLETNTLRQAWLGYGMLLGTTAFFSRFLNPNYLGYILTVLALGLWSDPIPTVPRTHLGQEGEDEG